MQQSLITPSKEWSLLRCWHVFFWFYLFAIIGNSDIVTCQSGKLCNCHKKDTQHRFGIAVRQFLTDSSCVMHQAYWPYFNLLPLMRLPITGSPAYAFRLLHLTFLPFTPNLRQVTCDSSYRSISVAINSSLASLPSLPSLCHYNSSCFVSDIDYLFRPM